MQKVLSFLSIIIISLALFSFVPQKKTKINWVTLAQAQAAYKTNPKPILIDVYTDWCGWCKVMDKETYSKKNVIDYVNKNFYAVKFNAEQTEAVVWNEKTYNYNQAYNTSDFAVYLLNGQMGYPSTLILPTLSTKPQPLAGYLKASELEPALKFFGDGYYKNQVFPDYMKTFSGKW